MIPSHCGSTRVMEVRNWDKNAMNSRNAPTRLRLSIILLCLLSPFCCSRAGVVSWIGASGDWNATNNWSTGALPGTNDDVLLTAGSSITVTHSTGTHSVHSIQGIQPFVLSGGSLAVSA